MQMLRSIATALILMISMFGFTVLAQDDDNAETIEYFVTGDSANLRAEPNTNATVVDVLVNGDSVLIYAEEPEVEGWLRVYRSGEDDAYIADFLVERAPERFYDPAQEPVLTVSGTGKEVSDVFDIPAGAYRIDAVVNDNAFILQSVVIAGDCRDDSILNELNFNTNQLVISALFVSQGCSIIFETDNVDGTWQFELRDILDPEYLDGAVQIEDGSEITGTGRSLSMITSLPEGVWQIDATVDDNAFILTAHPLTNDCDETSILNEFNPDDDSLEISTVYRSGGCIVFWETSNVDGSWTISFTKLR